MNLYFELDGKTVIPFKHVALTSGKVIYLLYPQGEFYTCGEEIPEEQLESYKKWIQDTTPTYVP